ncbi:MAG: YadA C-terminal domain-containing protein [Candidatus Thiodiazotropha sp. (ex Lucinoma borealis)]|nr:YadA C-terminal domain-containing protein [Candidatus Thiodiazotropha sp. (ex Lucinoma borealis)]MCU7862958.1 YadA C-terminal domain-containing protein [Candidatus Thiodiazotropha sp. (ex Lucinoma borealis)]
MNNLNFLLKSAFIFSMLIYTNTVIAAFAMAHDTDEGIVINANHGIGDCGGSLCPEGIALITGRDYDNSGGSGHPRNISQLYIDEYYVGVRVPITSLNGVNSNINFSNPINVNGNANIAQDLTAVDITSRRDLSVQRHAGVGGNIHVFGQSRLVGPISNPNGHVVINDTIMTTNQSGSNLRIMPGDFASITGASNQGLTINGSHTFVTGGTNSGILSLRDGNSEDGTTISISGSGGGRAATVFQTTTDSNTTTVNTLIGTNDTSYSNSMATLQAGDNFVSASASGGITAQSADSRLLLRADVARISSGSAGGYNTFSELQTIVTDNPAENEYQLVNGTPATQRIIEGESVQNVVIGNTLIDGELYVNGPVKQSAPAIINIVEGDNNTTVELTMIQEGDEGFVVNENGGIEEGVANQTTASLSVTNSNNQINGILSDETSTRISGGNVYSSNLGLSESGATFSDSFGAPIQVHGVADGKADFDAVNRRQLNYAFSGIAGVAALTQLPSPTLGKRYSFGVGVGHFENETAIALGFKSNYNENLSFSVGATRDTQDKTAISFGAGWSW